MKKVSDFLAPLDMRDIAYYFAKLENSYLYYHGRPMFHIKEIDYKNSKVIIEKCFYDHSEFEEIYSSDLFQVPGIINWGYYDEKSSMFKANIKPKPCKLSVEHRIYKTDPKQTKTYTIYGNDEMVMINKIHFKLVTDIDDNLKPENRYEYDEGEW